MTIDEHGLARPLSSPTNRIKTRRDLLKSTLAGVAAAALPSLAQATAASASAADGRFDALMTDFSDEMLRLSPSMATFLGLDNGPRAALKSRFERMTHEADARWADQVKSMAARLDRVDRNALGPQQQLRFDSLRYTVAAGIEASSFPFESAGSVIWGSAAPFPVTQQNSAVTFIPEFLDSNHGIAGKADAEAYLARIEAMARLIDDETARIDEQAAMGVMPPDFVMRTALAQLQAFRKTPAARQTLATSVSTRARKLGISGDWHARAAKLVDSAVYPALDRQIAAYAKAARKATSDAGVHRLPDGEAYYRWALKLSTTTSFSPEDVHRIGREQTSELDARMDAILRAQGMTRGTVGARMQALSVDPKRLFADDDKGRARLIAFCNERVAAIRKLLPQASHLGMKVPLTIKRTPVDIQDGAPLGVMSSASLDGARPAIYYINLKSTKLWPRHELTTLTAHEGVPGHALQGAYPAEYKLDVPVIASMVNYNAFVEGWALYAEQLVDELGLYATDPLSRLGYLQAQKFRSCRLVVDTGMHAMQWSRQQSIDFLHENTGRTVASCTSETDRYTVSPGQACGYKMGHNAILLQRERARKALGDRFDLAAFNDALIVSCGVPLDVLPTVVDQYLAAAG